MTYTLDDKSFIEHPLVRLFDELVHSGILMPSINNLHEAPEITKNRRNILTINIGRYYEINISDLDHETIAKGLAVMYGYGFVWAWFFIS